MPSPFPGMDPYLEDLAIFPDLHDSLIVYSREALNAVLPAPYYAGVASRVWVEATQRRTGPDVDVLRPRDGANGGPPGASGGGVAVAEAVLAEPVVIRIPREEHREQFLEIYAEPGGERLVTTLEILSPTNKMHSGHGRAPYLRKQEEVLQSQAHLVEIDLLRGGVHTTAVPLDRALEQTGPFDYHVCVHRFDQLDTFFVYPIRLAQRLPAIAIPLLPNDPPVRLDLQAVLDRCYDAGQYRRRVRYQDAAPEPPLSPEQMEWVRQVLRDRGILQPPTVSPG